MRILQSGLERLRLSEDYGILETLAGLDVFDIDDFLSDEWRDMISFCGKGELEYPVQSTPPETNISEADSWRELSKHPTNQIRKKDEIYLYYNADKKFVEIKIIVGLSQN